MRQERPTVLAIDPGTSKCGIAVVGVTDAQVLHHSVVPTAGLLGAVTDLCGEHSPEVILVGNGTSAGGAAEMLVETGCAPVRLVDEAMTSIAARKRFFKENPPRGLRKLLPTSLQTPPRPYDDYVAIILAERYLAGSAAEPDSPRTD